MAIDPLGLPPAEEHNRFIPPIVDEILEMKTESEWDDDDEAPGTEYVENEDGSVTVLDPEDEEKTIGFLDNLAESLSDRELATIASDYIELIEKDKQAREKRDEQYEEGIRRTGLGNDAPGGAAFSGASKVVHPVLAEGCVDFAARAIKELCPPNGPVKTQIFGKTEGKKLQKATRKRNYLNWQLTKQCPEFFAELEQMLSQLPLGGSQYIKILPNEAAKRPEFEFVPIDKLLVPFAATSFYQAQRVTHIQELTEQTFNRRVDSGYYRDIDILSPVQPTESKSEKASNKVEGKSADAYNDDGLRTVYEVAIYAEFKFDKVSGGKLAPYILVIDESMTTVLAIYRNWEEKDEGFNKLDWIVEFKFIPWRGAYGIGLPHLIGGIAAALTGALRALLDSAHINNAPSALKIKGARLSGQTQQVDIGQIQEIEAAPGVDDIRRLIMPMPFNAPSPVLFQLLDWLTGAAKGVVSTAEERIADASNQMPVGTALALIEQGSITYSAIHMRLHNSMAKVLEIVCRINYDLLDEEEVREELGEEIVYRKDFESATDIIPVSDPNIFSESQRYAQIQAVMQLMEVGKASGINYDATEVHRRALELMKVNDIEGILPIKPKPVEMNALAENVTLMLGNEVIVFPAQDHLSHIEAHLRFANDPNFGGNSVVAGKVLPQVLDHVAQHMAFLYADTCNTVANNIAPLGATSVDSKEMDQLLAAVSAKVAAVSQQVLQPIQQMLQQAQQSLAKYQPPQPKDPALVQEQIGMAEIERQKAKDLEEIKLKQGDQQAKASAEQVKQQESMAKAQADLQQQQIDNEKEIEKLRQAAEKIKHDATDMLNKAATEQQKLELAKEKQDIDYQLKMAELQRKEIEFAQKLNSDREQHVNNLISKHNLDVEETPNEDVRVSQLLRDQQEMESMVTALQQQLQQHFVAVENGDIMKAVLRQLAKPKTINVIRDARGRAISMTQE